SASGEVVHATRFDCEEQPFLSDHRLYNRIVVPGAMYAAMALRACSVPGQIRDLFFHEPLLLEEEGGRDLQLVLSAPAQAGPTTFEVFSTAHEESEDAWVRHASGQWQRVEESVSGQPEGTIDDLRQGLREKPLDELFAGYAAGGLELGPSFRALRSLWAAP